MCNMQYFVGDVVQLVTGFLEIVQLELRSGGGVISFVACLSELRFNRDVILTVIRIPGYNIIGTRCSSVVSYYNGVACADVCVYRASQSGAGRVSAELNSGGNQIVSITQCQLPLAHTGLIPH